MMTTVCYYFDHSPTLDGKWTDSYSTLLLYMSTQSPSAQCNYCSMTAAAKQHVNQHHEFRIRVNLKCYYSLTQLFEWHLFDSSTVVNIWRDK